VAGRRSITPFVAPRKWVTEGLRWHEERLRRSQPAVIRVAEGFPYFVLVRRLLAWPLLGTSGQQPTKEAPMTTQLRSALKRTTITLIAATLGTSLVALAGALTAPAQADSVLTTAGIIGFLGTATTAAPSAAGTLSLRGSLRVVSATISCPPEAPPDVAECRARTGEAPFPGLGTVSESYTWFFRIGPPACPSNLGKPLATAGRLVVAGKGELDFALAEGVKCVDVEPLRNEPQDFTITGGTGLYAGASGSGTVGRSLGGGVGTERWTGTLVAPEVEFDVTPPTLTGAEAKAVRAPKGVKGVRVTYRVTGRDEVDGELPVACQPRSGSRFMIGGTVVTCSATDMSANTRTARFRITVKATR
jgi:HYR domain